MEVLIVFIVIFSIPIIFLIALAIWTWKYRKDHKEGLEVEEAEREKWLEYLLENTTDEQLEAYINCVTRTHRYGVVNRKTYLKRNQRYRIKPWRRRR